MGDESVDLSHLHNDVTFEMQTRSERFTRIASTEPEHPDQIAVLQDLEFESTGDPATDLHARLLNTVARHMVQSDRMFEQVGASLGFDLRTLLAVVDKLIEQEKEIAELRDGLDELRRRL